MSEIETTPQGPRGPDGQHEQTGPDESQPPSEATSANGNAGHRRRWKRRLAVGLALAALIGLGLYYGVPWVEHWLKTVSTDDAYVAGHLTYLGPRISSRVEEVLVDEDDYVRAGEVLVRLDAQPFRLAVERAEAELQSAQSDLEKSRAETRADLATARADQYLTQSAVDQVRTQVATLRSAIAQLKLNEAQLALAEKDFTRLANLTAASAASRQQYDEAEASLEVARNQVASQTEIIQRIRAGLGLARNTEDPAEVPEDIEHTYSQVQVALANWAESLAGIGVPLDITGLSPEAVRKQLDDWLARQSSQGSVGTIVASAPRVQVAGAKVRQAQAAFDQAKLDLSYTDIKAPFDGFVTKRSVNPGDYVSPGQNLLAVQSLRDVWVNANFKETQLDDLRIGMPVEVHVDAYPGKVFAAHVAGFSPATGARLSLLPPENATGNFVKVVQRLPVRIELNEPPPTDTPLFVGLSVQPDVRFREPPRGPHAGQRLRLPWQSPAPGASAGAGGAGDLRGQLPARAAGRSKGASQ